MPPLPQHHSLTDLSDLKTHIGRKLGPERAQRYFICLNRFFGRKLSKNEFDKLCFKVLGHENIPLHNQFIRSVLRNAHQSMVSTPATSDKDVLRLNKEGGKLLSSTGNGSHSSRLSMSMPPVWSNGEILSPSPRKSRSVNQRIKDRPSPLGPNGKIDPVVRLHVPLDEAVLGGNSNLTTLDVKRPVQQLQGGIVDLPTKKQRAEESSPCDWGTVESASGNDINEVAVLKGDNVDQIVCAESGRGPLQAPLGIPFCPVSVGGARRSAHVSACSTNDIFASSYYGGELCHTETLRKRMEHIAETQGLEHVTMDCANLLNNGLDAYLKRLIGSCIDLAGSRPVHEHIKNPVSKQQTYLKNLNGISPGNHISAHSTVGSLEGCQEAKKHHPVTMLDFKAAMELNPQQLGEDWTLLLEKICHHSFDQ